MTEIIEGKRGGVGGALLFTGPAIVASVAYTDPKNYATNIQAGGVFGHSWEWVVLVANLIATLSQAHSARLGIVTGRNLTELFRAHFPKPVVQVMWVVLRIALPVPMVALIIFAGRTDVMGAFRTGPLVQVFAILGAAVALGQNFVLLAQMFGVPIPGLANG